MLGHLIGGGYVVFQLLFLQLWMEADVYPDDPG